MERERKRLKTCIPSREEIAPTLSGSVAAVDQSCTYAGTTRSNTTSSVMSGTVRNIGVNLDGSSLQELLCTQLGLFLNRNRESGICINRYTEINRTCDERLFEVLPDNLLTFLNTADLANLDMVSFHTTPLGLLRSRLPRMYTYVRYVTVDPWTDVCAMANWMAKRKLKAISIGIHSLKEKNGDKLGSFPFLRNISCFTSLPELQVFHSIKTVRIQAN